MVNEEYLEAVDKVCMDCAFGEETCPTCPVRRTVDLHKMGVKESALIDYILKKMHWCPFEDKSGVDFNTCVGFSEEGCKECIYRNTDKLLKE